jgi:hypothetical protein
MDIFEKTNIEDLLKKGRTRRISDSSIIEEVKGIFSENAKEREIIVQKLGEKSREAENLFKIDLLEANRIFHLQDIQKMCVTYRLRFLDSRFFKGVIPEEAVSNIRKLENEHQTTLNGFKIMAPAKLLKLENADDPLLFSPIGNDYYYLIHKWGTDLHPFRKVLMWPFKNFENLVFLVFILSILLTMAIPIGLFTKTPAMQEYFMLFLFVFKGMAGMVLFYGFSKGKNFNTAIWDSKYYNA